MKLLVSDYDGTFHTSESAIKINVEAVSKFRKQGNLFMLSTGRNYLSIKKHIDKYNIKYDFLSCKDGAILFDQNDILVRVSLFDNNVLYKLLIDLGKIKDLKHFESHGVYGKTGYNDDVVDMFIICKNMNSIDLLNKLLSEKYPFLQTFTYYGATYIERHGGKVRTIEEVRRLTCVDQVITVGDNVNDLSMLKAYDGYKVSTCFKSLDKENLPSCDGVAQLIKKLI